MFMKPRVSECWSNESSTGFEHYMSLLTILKSLSRQSSRPCRYLEPEIPPLFSELKAEHAMTARTSLGGTGLHVLPLLCTPAVLLQQLKDTDHNTCPAGRRNALRCNGGGGRGARRFECHTSHIVHNVFCFFDCQLISLEQTESNARRMASRT